MLACICTCTVCLLVCTCKHVISVRSLVYVHVQYVCLYMYMILSKERKTPEAMEK